MESEEAQGFVREAKDTDQEEAEETSFVPSAISVPRKPIFRCDNQGSEKTLSFWQLALVVFKEGEESYTTNFCQKCYKRFSDGKRRKPVTNWQWRQFAGQKAHRGRFWEMMGKEQYVRELWEYFCQERPKKKGKQESGVSGSWNCQLESNWSKFLSFNDTDCTHRTMKQERTMTTAIVSVAFGV